LCQLSARASLRISATSGDSPENYAKDYLGNVDEYAAANCPNRSPVNTGTIMDNNSNVIPSRLLTAFATRVGSTIVPAV
jgi:hypothetical protein